MKGKTNNGVYNSRNLGLYTYVHGNPLISIDPDGQAPTPQEAALMAAHVYGNKSDETLIGGWQVSNQNFGAQLNDRTGLNSAVYERVVGGKATEYAYVFAGTSPTAADVKADVAQPSGLSGQYANAVANAKTISKAVGDTELTLVGHSLGGGEAALGAMVTGRNAITFNAAGVTSATKMANGVSLLNTLCGRSCEGNINAYIMATDPLNAFQQGVGIGTGVNMSANGNIHYVAPQNMSSVYNGHSMNSMLNSMVNNDQYSK